MDNTEEISSKVKDKAEDIIMQAESDVIHSVRKIRLKEKEELDIEEIKYLIQKHIHYAI